MKQVMIIVALFSCVQAFAQHGLEKLSPGLRKMVSEKNTSDSVDIIVYASSLPNLYKACHLKLIKAYLPANTALVRVARADIGKLLQAKELVFADAWRQPKEEMTTGTLDISLNQISLAHQRFPGVNGDSVFASIKEQRFDTSDLDIRGRSFDSHVAAPDAATHATIMATMLAGAGNTSPYAVGAAWGARVTSSDFANLLPDADSVYRDYHITIQNHSYGTGIENYYGADAAAFDLSAKNNPGLLHVFSSGNAGLQTPSEGQYTGISGYANITGSFKMAKNILTVGATDSFNHVVAPSSRGPAYDGRVKPELVAFGEDGSSGAAALVSGSAALVQQAFRLQHQVMPSNAVVKAVLLNSASDVEQAHVDYNSGYGALNSYAAIKTVYENRIFEDSLVQDEVKDFPVSIPANIRQAKFTLVWMDKPAVPNAANALVNDLDAELEFSGTGASWLPWVLDPTPVATSLSADATRKADTLNTVEQITIKDPQPGDYVLHVKGSRVQTATKQPFAIAYELDTANQFYWSYPAFTDALPGQERNIIRWQSNIDDTASIEFSMDGLNWISLVHGVDLRRQYFEWQTPDTVSAAVLRMRVAGMDPFRSDSFTISRPLQLRVGFNCADSFLLYWNQLPVGQYRLLELGPRYLEPVLHTTDTALVLAKSQFSSPNFAVLPVIDGLEGLRSFTIDYTMQAAGCYISSFLGFPESAYASLKAVLGTSYNIASVALTRTNSAGTQVIHTWQPPFSLSLNYSDSGWQRGVNYYQLVIQLRDGRMITSSVEAVNYFPDLPVIVYPNPARQGEGIRIIAREPGVYTIVIYDANGRELRTQFLDDIAQPLSPVYLSKGVYFIRVIPESGKGFVEKVVVF